jgi:hypothetical protein
LQPHPYFNLLLHTDEELAAWIGLEVVRRQTLHEWPLSCVQKLTLADGRRLVYKSARQPTVEADFYAAARSPLLLKAQTVYQQGVYECLLIEWVDALTMEEAGCPEREAVRLGRKILEKIAEISGELPYYLDLRRVDGWEEVMDQILTPLNRLRVEGKLRLVGDDVVACIRRWCTDGRVLAALDGEHRLVHNDLAGDNIFLCPEGMRLIDWQRPIYGPPELDLLNLLESVGLDPQPYAAEGMLPLKRLLSIHWLAQCADRWFPEGVADYDRQIALLTVDLEKGA